MLPTLLLLIGLSSSANLGERPPGFRAEAIVQGQHRLGWESVTAFDGTDKATGAGWAIGQTVDVAATDLGQVGLLVGADYRHRNGGAWSKDTIWLRGGVIRTAHGHSLRLVCKATVWASDDTRSTAAELEYRARLGRWVVGTRQGVLWFIQPTAKAGYYMTATAGVALF